MMDNPIVNEVHRVRERLLARYNGDLRALVKDAQRRTEEASLSGRTVLKLPPLQPTDPLNKSKKAG
jgi:hypothetical protein